MDFSLPGMWASMGAVAKGVVVVLSLMSVYSLAVAIERFLHFRRARKESLAYIQAVRPLVGETGRLREAVGLDRRFRHSPVSRVVGTGLSEYARVAEHAAADDDDMGHLASIVRAMERSRDREMAGLRRGLSGLATVASSAPFVGLFGTVFGIITAFRLMADPARQGGGLGVVSAGIAEALVTTAVGLGVAILAVWFHNFLASRVDELTLDMEETASELADQIWRQGWGAETDAEESAARPMPARSPA